MNTINDLETNSNPPFEETVQVSIGNKALLGILTAEGLGQATVTLDDGIGA